MSTCGQRSRIFLSLARSACFILKVQKDASQKITFAGFNLRWILWRSISMVSFSEEQFIGSSFKPDFGEKMNENECSRDIKFDNSTSLNCGNLKITLLTIVNYDA